MKLLVTGGAGFIGSNFIHYMLGKHPQLRIVNVDKLTYAGNLENFSELEGDPRHTFFRLDICDTRAMEELFVEEAPDAVVNFAAESHVDRSITGPEVFVRTNIIGTLSLLEAARKSGTAVFLQISTDEVYGSLGESGFFTESSPLQPTSPYAASKTGAAHLVRPADHDPGSAILVTPDAALADAVAAEVDKQVAALRRADATRACLAKYGAIVLAADLEAASRIVNDLAPEHLQIQTEHPESVLRNIRSAGAVFLGRYTPVAVGDYVAGPSHTLPTGGTARWASGLTANDFLRSMSVMAYDRDALAADAQDILRMADAEGLTAHAESVKKRLE